MAEIDATAATTTTTVPVVANEEERHEGHIAHDMDYINFVANAMGGALFRGHLSEEQSKVELAGAIRAFAGLKPNDEVEGMLAAQLVALHAAGMECLRRAALNEQNAGARHTNLSLGTKLLRNFGLTLEVLNKHRGKGQQTVRVEHVTVNAGGQAIVGAVNHGGSKEEK